MWTKAVAAGKIPFLTIRKRVIAPASGTLAANFEE
jgi:hypothetical protein